MKTTIGTSFEGSRIGQRAAGQPGKLAAASRTAALPLQPPVPELIALAATVTELGALEQIMAELPPQTAPIVVVLAPDPAANVETVTRLDRNSRLRVTLARHGDPLVPGQVLVAPWDHAFALARSADQMTAALDDDPLCKCQRPYADTLFRAAAVYAGHRAIGVLLGGAKRDGVAGLLELRRRGARTIVLEHDPWATMDAVGEATRSGAASEVLSPTQIASVIGSCLAERAFDPHHPPHQQAS